MKPKSVLQWALLTAMACACSAAADDARSTVTPVAAGQTGPATELLRPVGANPIESSLIEHEGAGERYLLMDDNSVVAGVVYESGDAWVVQRSGGKIRFPKSRVQHVGESITDLYQFRAERIPVPDVPLRAKLATWCFENGMIHEAYAECKLILSIDPSSFAAKRVLKLCELTISPEPREETAARLRLNKPRTPEPARVVEQFKSAYGDETFSQYNKLVPLVVAKCGNSACHGSTRHDGSFRLYRRSDGSVRDLTLTARNLSSMLDEIDYEDPIRSPILYKAIQRHGATTLAPLGGVQDPTYVALQEWVFEITKRWAGNMVPVDEPVVPVEPQQPFQGDDGASLAKTRMIEQNGMILRHTGRPEAPVMQGGDDVSPVNGFQMPLADDAPAPTARSRPMGQPQQQTADPYDPSAFNQPRRKDVSPANVMLKRNEESMQFRRSLYMKRRFTAPTQDGGMVSEEVFESAPPPFNLRPYPGEEVIERDEFNTPE